MPTPEKYKLIDTLFPVAGQDNESQGFRDNFAATYDSLEFCETEISNLQQNTAKLNVENQFTEDSAIKGAKLVACSEEVFDLASSATIRDQEINYGFGGYQAFKLGAPENNVPYTFTITGWPNVDGLAANKGKYARIRVQLTSDGDVSRTPTFVTDNNSAIRYDKSWPATLTVSSETHPTVIEFWTYDGGDTVYAKYIGLFGAGTGTTSVENFITTGNTILGDTSADRVLFNAIPVLPSLTIDQLSTLSAVNGMIVYNSTDNDLTIKTESGWSSPGTPLLNGIGDVTITTPLNKQGLIYSSLTNEWKNSSIVNSVVAGTGVSVSAAQGDITITNTGVTQILAGNNITVDRTNGVVTISAASGGSSGGGITLDEAKDAAATILNHNLTHVGISFDYNTSSNRLSAIIDPTVVATLSDPQTLSNKTITAPIVSGLMTVSGSTGSAGQLLKINSSGSGMIWGDVNNRLDTLDDVEVNTPRAGDLLVYQSNISKWTNNTNLVEYTITVADDGSGTQEVFYIDGEALQTNTGTQFGLSFVVGKKYRFDISHASNADAPLRFSTSPDIAVPANIVDYTSNVIRNGVAGSEGAYVEIIVTDDTPSPLYMYAQENDPAIDTSLIGAAYPILVGNAVKVSIRNYTAIGNQIILVDSSTNATTIKLPDTPKLGTQIEIIDSGNAASNNITIDRNGKEIDGASSNVIISNNRGMVKLTYNGLGWTTSNYHRTGLVINNTTESSSTTSGALTVAGGVGIAKNLYVGGNIVLSSSNTFTTTNAKFDNINSVATDPLSIGGVLTLSNTTEASSVSAAALIISGGVGIAKKLFVAGETSLSNKVLLASSDALTNLGTASLTTAATYINTLIASTATLATGVNGQIKTFMMNQDTGDMVITVTNPGWVGTATGTMTFSAIGQGCTLQYINNKWFCIGNNGVVFG